MNNNLDLISSESTNVTIFKGKKKRTVKAEGNKGKRAATKKLKEAKKEKNLILNLNSTMKLRLKQKNLQNKLDKNLKDLFYNKPCYDNKVS